jgi:nucleotide-binding universal stress UspA family protein
MLGEVILSKILVAVDGSDGGEKAFLYAAAIAKKFDSNLLITHIIEEYGNVGTSIKNELEQDNQRILQKYLSRAKDLALTSSRVSVTKKKGCDVAEKLLEIAKKERIDTIVVGSRGRYLSSESFLVGGTSSKLVHYGSHTVIVVK